MSIKVSDQSHQYNEERQEKRFETMQAGWLILWKCQQCKIQWQCWELVTRRHNVEVANGPWAQAMSFLDGHGVPAAYPTVHFALIVSGSALLLWNGLAGGGDASRLALANITLHNIKATGLLTSAGWIRKILTWSNFRSGNNMDEGEVWC